MTKNEEEMFDNLESERIKSAIESLIFISNKPLTIDELKQLFENMDGETLRGIAETLKKEHEAKNSGVRIVEMAGGYQMVTTPQNSAYIKNFYKIRNTEKLSSPSLETLAIIAYKQPVTRVDIEAIRGVNVDGVVRSLLEKNLIKVVGRKEVIGRPFVYGTTRMFLDYFGLKSLEELPKIEEFAQQDLVLDMKLASGDADITPLTEEEEVKFQEENKAIAQKTEPKIETETQEDKAEQTERICDGNQQNP